MEEKKIKKKKIGKADWISIIFSCSIIGMLVASGILNSFWIFFIGIGSYWIIKQIILFVFKRGVKWWGIVIIVFSFLILLFITYFLILTFQFKKSIELGEIVVPNIIGQYSEIEGGNDNSEATITRSELESGNNPILGTDNPIMTIVEFSDFNCPYCALSYPTVKQFVLENDEKVKVIFKDLPLGDFDSALAANCAFEQNRFWDMHDKLFYYQEEISKDVIMSIAESMRLDMDSFKNCYDIKKYRNDIQGDLALGVRAGVEGTPTFFINGEKFAGVIPKNILEQILYAIEYGE